MSAQRLPSAGAFFRFFISVILLIVAVTVFLNRQYLLDTYMVARFDPSPAIASIAERTSLSSQGEFLFYASQPKLQEREQFNESCRSLLTEQTAVLGCYAKNKIYLFDIDDERLDGIIEVTAAHEMLHAAYQRLSNSEKTRVNALLEKQGLGDEGSRIAELMASYEKTEPGERLNELHSILGSEIGSLDPELESYYQQYFDNRSAVVSLSEQYQTVFNELKAKQDSLVAELNSLVDDIDSRSAVYKRNLQILSADIESFNRAASSGDMSREQYESTRRDLENRQDRLRRDYNQIQAMIDMYEQKRNELAAINLESTALNRSINSSLTPVPDAIDG